MHDPFSAPSIKIGDVERPFYTNDIPLAAQAAGDAIYRHIAASSPDCRYLVSQHLRIAGGVVHTLSLLSVETSDLVINDSYGKGPEGIASLSLKALTVSSFAGSYAVSHARGSREIWNSIGMVEDLEVIGLFGPWDLPHEYVDLAQYANYVEKEQALRFRQTV